MYNKLKSSLIVSAFSLCIGSTCLAIGDDINPNGGNIPPSIVNAVNTILGAVQWIGFIVGVAMIIYVGIKYLTAGAGQKAEVKSTMVPILVGAVLVMLAPTIARWLFGMFG